MSLKCRNRVLIVSAYEDRKWPLVRSKFAQQLETVHARHLNVQEQQIRGLQPDHLDRFAPVSTGPRDFNIGLLFEKIHDAGQRRLFIIDYERSNLVHGASTNRKVRSTRPEGREMQVRQSPDTASEVGVEILLMALRRNQEQSLTRTALETSLRSARTQPWHKS